MTTELYWLTLTIFMTGLFWLPYILNRIGVRGLVTAVSGTEAEHGSDQPMWAQRAMRAHANAVENLVLFAPAVLIAHVLDISTPVTQAAVIIYFFARLVHFVVYTAGIPVARTLAYAAGWLATIVIVFTILGWI